MRNIDKQALREEFKMMQECYSDPADRDRQVIYIAAEALLDELEAAGKRIAELEAREVKPVAWRLINSPESSLSVTDNKHIADVWKRNGRDVQALSPVPPVSLVLAGTVLSDGRQMSVHNKSMVVDVVVESGKLMPGDKLYIAAAADKGEAS